MPKITAKFSWAILVSAAVYFGALSPFPVRADNRDQTGLAWPLTLRKQILRLNAVDWRVRQAAGTLCPANNPSVGFSIDYIGAYETPDQARHRQDLIMGILPQISAVASDSPADKVGIKPGDAILSINGMPAASTYAPDSTKNNVPVLPPDGIIEWLQTQPIDQPITLVLKRGSMTLRKKVKPVPLCAGQTVFTTDEALEAYSDGTDLAITTGLIAFTENDDELALVLGHELAHVILRHEPSTNTDIDSPNDERQADILGSHLATCAGYDAQNAATFWSRYHALYGYSQSNATTHASPNERRLSIINAAPAFTCPLNLSALALSAPK